MLTLNVVVAKPAPKNTFRLDGATSTSSISDKQMEINKTQDKIMELRAKENPNFFMKRLNEFRIEMLENKLKSDSKKEG